MNVSSFNANQLFTKTRFRKFSWIRPYDANYANYVDCIPEEINGSCF